MNLRFNSIMIVARYTFIEIYKSRVLLNILFLGLALLIVSYVASEFSYGVRSRIALDFGMGALYVATVGIAMFFGVNLLSKEVETRTCYMILSRPISRSSFLMGKVLGMSAMLAVNIFLLGTLSTLCFFYLGGQLNSLIIWCLVLSFLESLIILLVVLLFSLVSNTTISIIGTIGVFVVGHALPATLEKINHQTLNTVLYNIMKISSIIIPNLEKLNVRDFLIYEQNLSDHYLMTVLSYALVYITVLLLINLSVFQKKQLD